LPEAELLLDAHATRLERVALPHAQTAHVERAIRLDHGRARAGARGGEVGLVGAGERGADLELTPLGGRDAGDRAGDHRAGLELPAEIPQLDAGLLRRALDHEVRVVVAAHDEAPRAAGQRLDAEASVGPGDRARLALADEEEIGPVVELGLEDARPWNPVAVRID